MSFIKRHGMEGMHTGSGSMTMASATSSMDTSMSSSTMHSGMDMGGMEQMTGMQMYFLGQYKDVAVLFKNLKASNGGQAFGIFLLLLLVGMLVRGIEFANRYVEQVVWQNPNYSDQCHPPNGPIITPVVAEGNCCGANTGNTSANSIGKMDSSDLVVGEQVHEGTFGGSQRSQLPMASILSRNFIRLALSIVTELLIFSLMLAAMTFSLLYFFAVVLGLGIGRFVFDRLSDSMKIRPSAISLHH